MGKNVFKICWIIVIISVITLCTPAFAALNTIPLGGTVFIGEEGLDVSATGAVSGSSIGWYGSTGNPGGVPSATYIVDDEANFYIAPAIFSGKTGPWFTMPGNRLAFYVEDPTLVLRIYDESSDFQVTGTTKWVPKGDAIGFRIETNLFQMAKRPGSKGAPVTIRIKSPDGTEYTSVSGNSLTDFPVSTSPYPTGPIWYTGDYSSGTYTVWAESNANGMKDNYDRVGKTVTPQEPNLLIQSVNPLITKSTAVATTKQPVVTTATEPPAPVPPTSQTTVVTSTIPTTSAVSPVATSIPATPRPSPTPTTGLQGYVLIAGLVIAAIVTGRMKSI
jgi:hypothetical protein